MLHDAELYTKIKQGTRKANTFSDRRIASAIHRFEMGNFDTLPNHSHLHQNWIKNCNLQNQGYKDTSWIIVQKIEQHIVQMRDSQGERISLLSNLTIFLFKKK